MIRVAFDIDGVLADMHTALAREAERLFGAPGDAAAGPLEGPYLHLTARQTARLWEAVQQTENFWDQLEELEPGAVARLASVAAERHWEVLFLTRRPPTRGATSQQQTQRWLERHGFELPSVVTTRGGRGVIAAALQLDALVDDRFESCAAVAAESEARSILVWREPDAEAPAGARRLGIIVVRSVGECLDMLQQVDHHTGTAPGLMGRLKHALGLKQQ